jgi:tRNA threonylcarbamoyladenosine biosynthesis protein TsaE
MDAADSQPLTLEIASEQAMNALGIEIAATIVQLSAPLVVFLYGDLGAGKTTLSRGVLRGLGHVGAVKSPTYTLVEPYESEIGRVFHFDLYRLKDPEELEHMGFRDYLAEARLCLLEWPENGRGFLPQPDLTVKIAPSAEGRCVTLQASNKMGQLLVDGVKTFKMIASNG